MNIKLTTNSIIHCQERQQCSAVTNILHKDGYVWNDVHRKSLAKHDFWVRARENTALIIDISAKTVDTRNINSDWFSDPDHQYPIMNAIDFLKLHNYKIPSKPMSYKYLYAIQTKENENFIIDVLENHGGINKFALNPKFMSSEVKHLFYIDNVDKTIRVINIDYNRRDYLNIIQNGKDIFLDIETAKINNNTTKNSKEMSFEELQNAQKGIIKHFEAERNKAKKIDKPTTALSTLQAESKLVDALPTDVYYYGDPLRGDEVIAALEKLGGINYRSCCSGKNEERLYYISKENNYITNCLPKTDKELAGFITRFYKMLTLPPIEIIEIEGKKYRKEEVLEKLKNLKTY